MSLQRTILFYLVFTAVIAGMCLLLPAVFPGQELFITNFWLLFFFLSGITFIALIVALLGIRHKPETGVMAIMGSIVLKMLFSLGFILLYMMKMPVNKFLFILNFFSLYFLFSGFEMYCLLRTLRHQNKK